MSLNREQYKKLYDNAKYIYLQSRLPDVRRKAKEIAALAEGVIGQQDRQPVECWKE